MLALIAAAVVYAADGDLDSTFGTDGKLTTDVAGQNDVAYGVTTDGGGRIVVVGSARTSEEFDFGLVRYRPDGSLDATFGSNGRVTTDFNHLSDRARHVLIDASGKLVVIGGAEILRANSDGSYYRSDDFGLARYNTDGSLDATFGDGGKVVTDLGHIDDAFTAAFVGGGKLVVLGFSYPSFGLARYTENGTLDSSFGVGGIAKIQIGDQAWGSGLAIDAQGRIVVAGTVDSARSRDLFVARFSADGTLDATFGTGGVATADFGQGEMASALTIDSVGRIVIAGANQSLSSGGLLDFLLVRYRSDGSLDPTFDGDGHLTTDFSGFGDMATAVRVDAVGRIVLSGESGDGISKNVAVARYKSDGSLDAAFGIGGKMTTDFTGADDVAWALTLDPNGRLVVAGTSGTGIDADFALARYDAAPPPPPADLGVSLAVDRPNAVNVGDLLTYTLVVGNAGPNAAANVVVTDILSTGTTFVSARSNKGSLAVPPAGQGGVVRWNLGAMAVGSSEQAKLTITVSVRGKTSVVNEASVIADTPDPNASNNLASITTKVGAGARTR